MTLPAPAPKTMLQQARASQKARAGNADLKLTAALMRDDHWAKGEGWTGPRPRPDSSADTTNVARVTEEIRRNFVSRNLPENVVSRHVYGIAGREPLLGITAKDLADGQEPGDEQKKQAGDYLAAFREWWDNSGVWLSIQQALKNAVWSGKGTLRLFIPKSKLQPMEAEGEEALGIPGGLTLGQALGYVSVHAPAWDAAGVLRDGDQRVTCAYYRYTDEQDREHWELQERLDGKTRVIPDARAGADTQEFTDYDVSNLLIFEVSLDPLVKHSIRSLALFADKTLTMGSRNIDLGGFVERTILNAQMPGKWVEDKSASAGRRFVPEPYHVGAGVTNFLSGVAVMQPDPNDPKKLVPSGQFSSPSVQYKDPTGWNVFGETFSAIREAIFDEAKQLHVLITGDASASGVSRQQAVNDFLSSLEPTRMALEQMVRWLMSTVLRLGLDIVGRPGEWDAYKATVQARTSAVQPTSAEVESALNLRKAGLISRKTFYSRVGIEEAEAEAAAIAAEGITPDVALVILPTLPVPWLQMKVAQMAWPALGLTDQDVARQKELDTAGPQKAQGGAPEPQPGNEGGDGQPGV